MTNSTLRTRLLNDQLAVCYRLNTAVGACVSVHDDNDWGHLYFTLEDGVLHLWWTGIGPFQLQISYDLVTWYDEGTCRQGPADMVVTPRDQGGPQFYRVVPCSTNPPPPQ